MKFVCPVCGYVFDEAREKAAFSSLPETWQCPICKAAKSLFTPQEGEAPTISGEPAQAEELRPLTPGELAAVFSNLARGCEKQYHPEEEARFQELAAYFAGLAPQEPDASVAQLLAFFQEELAQGYPAYQAAAQAAGDRGSQRVRVPVFLAWDLGRGVLPSSPAISPRSKRRVYSKPSRQTVTSM